MYEYCCRTYFLMKKLVKSEVCGPVNSARVHGSLLKSQNMRLEKKERKEMQMWTRKRESKRIHRKKRQDIHLYYNFLM